MIEKQWEKICDGEMTRQNLEGHYVCSYYIATDGEVVRIIFGEDEPIIQTMSHCLSSTGYPMVNINVGMKRKNVHVHVLLGRFLEKPEGATEINHIDGDKTNYSLSNLEWVTRSENQLHAYRTGLKHAQRGAANGRAKLNEKQVRVIKHCLKEKWYGINQADLAKFFGVAHTTIGYIAAGRRYTDVTI